MSSLFYDRNDTLCSKHIYVMPSADCELVYVMSDMRNICERMENNQILSHS